MLCKSNQLRRELIGTISTIIKVLCKTNRWTRTCARYIGKNICVTGLIELNEFVGVYETVATDSSAIEVVVAWDETDDYADDIVTVHGPVVGINDLSDRAGTKKLLVGLEDGGFQIDIANDVEGNFPSLEGYVGKYIYVTGLLVLNEFVGVYEMVITEPSVIVIAE